MKTKLLLVLLTVAILLCACTSGDGKDTSSAGVTAESSVAQESSEDAVSETSSAPVDESSEVSEPADESSDISEPDDESSDSADVSDDVSQEDPPELIDVDYVSVDSLSNPVLQLPCHTRDNLPEDFIAAMQNNPIDIDFWAEFAETEDSLLQKYAVIWQAEVDRAAEDLCNALDADEIGDLPNIVDKTILVGHRKIDLDWKYYLNIDEGAYLGTYIYYALDAGYLDVYRQLTFRLKYMLYLIETADGGTADASLQFVHTPTYQGEGDELVVITADDGFLIRAPYSPSYTYEDGTAYINAMRYNPIDQTEAPTLEAFEQEIAYALEQMKELLSADSQALFAQYIDSVTAEIRFYESLFSVLYDLSYIENDICAQQEIESYRQVLFSLKYWMFVLETENDDDPNLSFTFSK